MMAHNVIDINIHHAFEAEYKGKIIEILNKYKSRNVGEKTKEKIREEIKALDTDVIQSVFLRIKYDYICVYIKNTNIEIEVHKVDNWLNDGNKEKIKQYNKFYSANDNFKISEYRL